MNNLLKKLSLSALMCISLTACYNSSSTVTASTPESSYIAAPGVHITVPVTFNANNGTVNNLHITSSLPSGWSIQNGQSAFNCATVNATGNGCQLNLTFAPTTVTNNTSFNLTYTYTTNTGINNAGSLLIPYAAVPNSVFIPDQGNNNVIQCTINPADGTMPSYGCSTVVQSNVSYPKDIVLQNFGNNKYIYVLNSYLASNPVPALNNTVISCPISSNGSIGACSSPLTVDPADGSSVDVTSIVFQNVNSNLYAYITNYFGNVIKCAANQDGTLSSCAFESETSSSSAAITFQEATDTGIMYAYITDAASNSIMVCTVDSTTGELGSCNPVTLSQQNILNTPYATTFQTSNGTIYAYIANGPSPANTAPAAGYITQCTVPSVGSTNFSNCANTGGVNGPNFGIASLLSLANISGTTYAYVVNYRIGYHGYPGGIAKCAVNPVNGSLSGCTYMLQNIYNPLAFHPVGMAFFTAGS